MKMKLHNLKQHRTRNKIANPVIREIFRSSDQVYHEDRLQSKQFALLSKLAQNSKVRTIHVASVSFR